MGRKYNKLTEKANNANWQETDQLGFSLQCKSADEELNQRLPELGIAKFQVWRPNHSVTLHTEFQFLPSHLVYFSLADENFMAAKVMKVSSLKWFQRRFTALSHTGSPLNPDSSFTQDRLPQALSINTVVGSLRTPPNACTATNRIDERK